LIETEGQGHRSILPDNGRASILAANKRSPLSQFQDLNRLVDRGDLSIDCSKSVSVKSLNLTSTGVQSKKFLDILP